VAEPIGSSVPVRANYFLLALSPTVSSETSAIRTQTPGNYPKSAENPGTMTETHHTLNY